MFAAKEAAGRGRGGEGERGRGEKYRQSWAPCFPENHHLRSGGLVMTCKLLEEREKE